MPFDALKSKKPLLIKKTVTTAKPAPKQTITKRPAVVPPSNSSATARVSKTDARRSYPTPPAERPNRDRKRSTPARAGGSPQILDFGDDSDDGSDEEALRAVKRPRIATPDDLPPRKVRSVAAFTENEDDSEMLEIIHGKEVPSLDSRVKYETLFEGLPAGSEVELQYPSASQPETFALIKGKKHSDYNALEDIHATMKMVAKYYLPEDMRERFDHESTGYPQRLNRAANKRNLEDLENVMEEWNEQMTKLRKNGTLAKSLDSLRRIPAELVERILNQAHMRTVSPDDHVLHAYQAGSNEVYGELLPRFISQIINQDTKMSSEQVFVDLGSGVGNVVLQVALEAGCESWGCEINDKYCNLAEAQQREFEARCKLWGLAHGKIHLERGNFIQNDKIRDALKRADVLVVNNEVFSSELNDSLKYLFLDLKEGCKIVSLKSFVPEDHKISARNANDPANILKVVKKEYFSGSVSWKDRAGTYFISTKNSSVQRRFLKAVSGGDRALQA